MWKKLLFILMIPAAAFSLQTFVDHRPMEWTAPAIFRTNLDAQGDLTVTGDLTATTLGVSTLDLANGTALLPSLTFSTDLNTGLYRVGADNLGITAAGTLVAEVQAGQVLVVDGTAALPSYGFTGAATTGLYRVAATDDLAVSTAGVQRARWSSAGLWFTPAGTAAAPVIARASDPNTGFYFAAADQMAVTAGGSNVATFWIDAGGNPEMILDDGDVNNPTLRFASDADAGWYLAGANSMAATIGSGINHLTINGSGVAIGLQGSIATPSLRNANDVNTGFYWPAAGHLGMSLSDVRYGEWAMTTTLITATQVRKLNAAPITLIAAPAAGTSVQVERVQVWLNWAAVAYDSVVAGETWVIEFADGSDIIVPQDPTLAPFIVTSVADQQAYVEVGDTLRNVVDNSAVQISVTTAEWATTDDDSDGDSPITVRVYYRLVDVLS